MYKYLFKIFLFSILFSFFSFSQDTDWKINFNKALQFYNNGQYQEAIEFAKKSVQIARKEFGNDHENTLISLSNLAMFYVQVDKYEEPLDILLKIIKVRKEKYFRTKDNKAKNLYLQSMFNLAKFYINYDLINEAEVIFQKILDEDISFWENISALSLEVFKGSDIEKAINILENIYPKVKEHFGPFHENTLKILNNLAIMYKVNNDLNKAIKYMSIIVACQKKKYNKNKKNEDNLLVFVKVLISMADIYLKVPNYDKSLDFYCEAQGIIENFYPPSKPMKKRAQDLLAVLYNKLGYAYYVCGIYDNAIHFFQNSLEVIKYFDLYKKGHYKATVMSNLASAYMLRLGEQDIINAEKNFILAKNIAEREYNLNQNIYNSIQLIKFLTNLGGFYNERKKYEEAKPIFKKTLKLSKEIIKKQFTKDNLILWAESMNNLGGVYQNTYNIEKAESYFVTALKTLKKEGLEGHVIVAELMRNLGTLCANNERLDDAMSVYRTAFIVDMKNFGSEHPKTALDLYHMARTYLDQKHYDKAIELYEEAWKIYEKHFGRENKQINIIRNDLSVIKKIIDIKQKNLERFLLQEMAQYKEDIPKDQVIYFAKIFIYLAWLSALKDETRQNKKFLRLGKELLEKYNVTNNTFMFLILFRFAKIYQKERKFKKALSYYAKALSILNTLPDKSYILVIIRETTLIKHLLKLQKENK